ncbi:MAG: RIP metalloprotease RseP [Alphaproteobacteria bacterium]|nr:RIP metalloprotease RseP [Alphaproteobacteria bacterium]
MGALAELFSSPLEAIFWFLVVLTPVVFIHELGHYLLARWNNVRIEVFSIGFGPEIFGFTDRAETRWKFSLLPLGGYVKMLGQGDLTPDETAFAHEFIQDRERAFVSKRPWQKMLIVLAGPMANFVFSITVFAVVFATVGQAFTPARIAEIVPGSAAEEAGLQPGDVILSVNGRGVSRFEELAQLIQLEPGQPVTLRLLRTERELEIKATPRVEKRDSPLGEKVSIGVLGVKVPAGEFKRHDPVTAVWEAGRQTVRLGSVFFIAVGQMIVGDRSFDELGGPVRIAQMSSVAATESGLLGAVFFAAYLSVTLGVINLLPIPALDGGHLVFYLYEAVRGKPPSLRWQEISLRLGLALLLGLMIFATFNDVMRLPFVRQVFGMLS